GGVRHDAKMRARLGGLAEDVDAVHAGAALIGRDHAVDHAQAGGLAGAVGTQKAGDLAVARQEADLARRLPRAETLPQALRFDHGEGPVELTKNGVTTCRCRHSAFNSSGAAPFKNCSMSLGTQLVASCPCPSPLNTRWRWCTRPRAARSAYAGGVTGSASP